MSFTPGPPDKDNYAPLSHDHAQAISDAIDQAQRRAWWRRALMLPCFAVLAGVQVVRRRLGRGE